MRKMSSILLLLIWMVFTTTSRGYPCTAFLLLNKGRPVVGKNYDWSIENGLLIVNKKGVQKTAVQYKDEKYGQPVKWKSKFGSITFNQFGRELPMGGMNEAGLVVEVLMLSDTVYPEPDSRPSISVLQWVQYQLDNFRETKEVIESNAHLRILPSLSGPGMHYFISDRNGHSAVVEFLDGELRCYTEKTMPVRVLTNSTYEEGFRSWERERSIHSNQYNRGSRFVRAANLLEMYKKESRENPLEYVFYILDYVSQASFTKWSIVYDIQNLAIYFRTLSNPRIRHIVLQDFDFSCNSPVLVLSVNRNLSGDVAGYFTEYRQEDNRLLVKNIFRSISVDDTNREKLSRKIVLYPEENICVY